MTATSERSRPSKGNTGYAALVHGRAVGRLRRRRPRAGGHAAATVTIGGLLARLAGP